MLHPALIRVPHTPLAHSRPGFFGLRPHHRCTGVEAWQASGETALRTQLRTSPRHLLLPFAPPSLLKHHLVMPVLPGSPMMSYGFFLGP